MLIFPEYIDKLMKSFEEMISDPEAWSALAEFYAELAECDEGPTAFAEAIICVSRIPNGEKVLRCNLRKSSVITRLGLRLMFITNSNQLAFSVSWTAERI